MAVDLKLPVDVRVTQGLHPQNVASIEDFDDDTRGVLGQVVDAFTVAYDGVAKVFDARVVAANDQSLTEAAQLIRTQEMADRVFQRAAGVFDKVSSNLQAGIAQLEKELTAPVQARAAHTISVEIRNYVRSLAEASTSPADKRPKQSVLGFVQQAIKDGDVDTVSAVLGAPAYLSGIDANMQSMLLRMWHEKANPGTAKRVRAMKAALDLVHERGGLLFNDLEKAVGAPPHKVKALKDAKAKTDKAFSL